ncbi:hypothetical protein PMI01_01126 [Caulobacter sp. AP07]|uniref:hypothetical protein n=1 Tax=Caulobacter sp. AP07 TaxID=1144304 RepID=UPI000271E372|nr:hypothetical protein [Caulobacter sp. AP07]EJL36055.1 hypothetical protein PMI01_01126 [Caulobacter sp. AP07]
MKYLRWLLVVAVTLYALTSAIPASFTVLHKLHLLKLPAMVKSHGVLMDAMSWPQVILWWVAVVLFLVAAWRLAFAKGRAWLVFVIAFAGDLLGWLWMQGPAYDATFPASQRQSDLVILAVLAVIGALIAWVELRKTPLN